MKPKKRTDAKECHQCYGYGLWAMGSGWPMGPMDAREGYPTIPCPECGANANPMKRKAAK